MVHWGSVNCDPPTPKDNTDAAWRSHLIDLSGTVGLPRITESNVEEWMWRILFLRKMLHEECGYLHFSKNGKLERVGITMEILRRWSGLWTNWSEHTRSSFTKQYIDRMYREIDADVRSSREEKPAVIKSRKKVRAK